MRDGWTRTRLGEVCEVVRERVDPRLLPPDRLLTHFSIPALDATGGPAIEPAGDIRSHKFRVNRQAVLLSLLNPRIPRSVLAPGGPNVVCSTEMAVLEPRPDSGLTVEFLAFYASTEAMRAALLRLVGGTTGSRQRVDPSELPSVSIVVPPISQQLRIVDLLTAVDDAIEAADREGDATASVLRLHLHRAITSPTDQRLRLGDLAEMGSGPSWASADEVTGEHADATPVVGITATPSSSSWIDASRSRFVRGLPGSTRRLTRDSLLLIRTNGNRDRVGNVYRVPEPAVGHAYSAFQIGLFPREAGDMRWLFWCLASPDIQGSISTAASGSTGLSNIAVTWLKNLQIPWPDAQARAWMIETAEALERVRESTAALSERLRQLRRGVLSDLLSGDHEIRPSYDRFLDGAT